MAQSGYQAGSFTAGEIPTTAIWNMLWSNDASFNTGNGINDAAIITRHLGLNSVTNETVVFNEVAGISPGPQTIGASWTDITNWTGGSLTTSGGTVLFFVSLTAWSSATSQQVAFRLVVGSNNYPSTNGFKYYFNASGDHRFVGRCLVVTGLSAGTYTVKMQAELAVSNGGTINIDAGDWLSVIALETLR